MFIAGIYVAFFPFCVLYLISRPPKYVKSKTFDKKYGTLTEEVFRKKTMYQRAYYVLFVFDRLVLTLTLVYLYYHPFYQMCIILFSQLLMIAYMIKFRPFRSELQQVISVSDEFVIVFGIILLYFLWRNQHDVNTSSKIGMAIITVILISMIKNMGIISYISITNSYKKFRKWAHKKLMVKTHERKKRRKDRRKRRETLKQEQEEKEIIDRIFIGELKPNQVKLASQPSIINHMIKVERPESSASIKKKGLAIEMRKKHSSLIYLPEANSDSPLSCKTPNRRRFRSLIVNTKRARYSKRMITLGSAKMPNSSLEPIQEEVVEDDYAMSSFARLVQKQEY